MHTTAVLFVLSASRSIFHSFNTQEMVAEQERQEAEAAGAGPLSPKGA